MDELIWLNGVVMPLASARVGVEDRGFQFADGVYEVIRVYGGVPFALDGHLQRFERSCEAIDLSLGFPRQKLAEEMREVVEQSGLREGMIYAQITRGQCARNHAYPTGVVPTLLFYVRELPPVMPPGKSEGVKLLSVPDERWHKCWIKSIALLPNVLAKNKALAAGADEAVFIHNGNVTECSASNIHVIRGKSLVTHPAGEKVLPGITRDVLLQLAPQAGLSVDQRPIAEPEALAADEIFITSTTREVAWVREWNGAAVGGGRCGPHTLRLHQVLGEYVRRSTSR